MAHQVFISYASADAVVAGRVCAALESGGLSCWIAPRDIGPGTDYPAAIVDGVAACSVMVVILTASAVASPHIVTEVGHAFNAKKRIIPFRLAPAALSKDLDYFLSMAQWLDARDGCTDQSLALLTEAAAAAIRGEARPEEGASKGLARSPNRRVLIGLLALVTVTLAVWKWPRPARPGPAIPRTSSNAPAPANAVPAITVPANAVPANGAPTAPAAKALPDKTWLNPKDGQVYVWIPPGTFTMGCSASDSQCSDDEKPAHPVEIPKGFWLARTEATVAAYRQ